MLQESAPIGWDLRTMNVGTSFSLKIYVLFLLVIFIATSIRLARVWRMAPPFRPNRQRDNLAYPVLLRTSAASLKQWASLTYLGWGIFASTAAYNICNRLLEGIRMSSVFLVFGIREFSSALTMALLVALF